MRALAFVLICASVAACAPKWEEPMPTSPEAWQRRQEQIKRQEDERQRLCALAGNNEEARKRACRHEDRN